MREVVPAVVRVIDVPEGVTLGELHDLSQAALGWTDSHLHQFTADGVRYGVPDPDGYDLQVHDEVAARLRDLPARFEYLYDFGDGWEHGVEVLGRGGEIPGCVEGTGGCPPKDCGGPPGNEHLREVLADPHHEEHDQPRKWVGELPSFDRRATDLLVRQTVGAVPESLRLLLDLLAGGVNLTPGGRLPRLVLRAVQERRPEWCPLDRPASIEEDCSRWPSCTRSCVGPDWPGWGTGCCALRVRPRTTARWSVCVPGSSPRVSGASSAAWRLRFWRSPDRFRPPS